MTEVENLTGKEDDRAALLDGEAIKSIPYGARIPPSFSSFIRFTKGSIRFAYVCLLVFILLARFVMLEESFLIENRMLLRAAYVNPCIEFS